jgi:hypothetical protein
VVDLSDDEDGDNLTTQVFTLDASSALRDWTRSLPGRPAIMLRKCSVSR